MWTVHVEGEANVGSRARGWGGGLHVIRGNSNVRQPLHMYRLVIAKRINSAITSLIRVIPRAVLYHYISLHSCCWSGWRGGVGGLGVSQAKD